jgi:hypothetical protein
MYMITPELLRCDKCDSAAPILLMQDEDGAMRPRAAMRGYDLYVFINCPKCGEREQLALTPGEIDRFSNE